MGHYNRRRGTHHLNERKRYNLKHPRLNKHGGRKYKRNQRWNIEKNKHLKRVECVNKKLCWYD